VEGKKPRTVNFEKWRPSDSSSLTAADGALPQWTEDISSYSWTAMMIRKKIVQNQEEGKSRGPLTALKRMVTIPRKLNMDHLKVSLTSESGKKMERN
jgi:hypothetical protein